MRCGATIRERIFTFPLTSHCHPNTIRFIKHCLLPADDVEAVFQLSFTSCKRQTTCKTFEKDHVVVFIGSVISAQQKITHGSPVKRRMWKQCFSSRSLLASVKRLARPLKKITSRFHRLCYICSAEYQSRVTSPSWDVGCGNNVLVLAHFLTTEVE
ncbi:hypothetical protein T10_9411 [Trichinella papuae]|uniref:Uncharacterized protein n=1 Tax=Trichinella papuae TaxID=268474 RepID=A0A0V1MAK1_9BILA|nr:hypothetical protein T10_9411 [Trichinella papuae]